jgi:tRNA (guanine37-N1)-methyltransferase
MRLTILTLFPEMLDAPLSHSIVKRAREEKLVDIALINIRDFGIGRHKVVDDTPYGGGVGMVLRPDVISEAITHARASLDTPSHVVLLDARGATYTQRTAARFAALSHLILVCGHYEGVDERVRDLVDETVSIGDVILTGGEIPALAIADSVIRLIPGVLDQDATTHESFQQGLLEGPHYTKPRIFNNISVPDVLLSGNHAHIDAWRKEQSLLITKTHRPDLAVNEESVSDQRGE